MEQLERLLSQLPEQHRNALRWFHSHAGTVQQWPAPLPDGTLIVSKAQGIYKPNWSKYALSVRQNLSSPYHDQEPITRRDGTWSYLYAEESTNPSSRDSDYANRSLEACMSDRVPVGVLRQVNSKGSSQYAILGLALISGRGDGFFFLEGFSPIGLAENQGPRPQIDALLEKTTKNSLATGVFDVTSLADQRERSIASIIRRRGQPEFRRTLLNAYENKCAITGCDAEEALEACHILPYRGSQTDHPSNGLLLRADIHVLFDLGLICIDSNSMTIMIADSLRKSDYRNLEGIHLNLPKNAGLRPSKEALDYQRQWAAISVGASK